MVIIRLFDNLCGPPKTSPKKAYLTVTSKRNNRPTLESTTVGRVFNRAPDLPGLGAVLNVHNSGSENPPPGNFSPTGSFVDTRRFFNAFQSERTAGSFILIFNFNFFGKSPNLAGFLILKYF